MGTFRSVLVALAALALCGGALALVVAAIAAALRARVRPPALAVSEALGDGALVLDRGGRIVFASAAARAILRGPTVGGLEGLPAATLVPEVEALRRGAARGPAAAELTVRGPAGEARARAALVRIATRPPRDLLVLRAPAAAARPPPLPGPVAPAPASAERHGDLAAVSAALRAPLARAATGAALLRLLLEGPDDRASAELHRVEAALGELEARLGAIAALAATGAGRPQVVHLGRVVEDVLDGLVLPPAVRVRRAIAPAPALGDEARLRAALRAVLRAAVDALPAGGELAVAVAARGGSAVVEIASPGLDPGADGAAALARALLGPDGARVEREVVPGRARLVRIALPAAPGAEPRRDERFDAAGTGR